MPRLARAALLCAAWWIASIAWAAPPAGEPTLPAQDWQVIRSVVEAQLAALRSGDGAKAISYAAPGIRAQFRTPDNFLRMVRNGYPALLTARYTQFLDGAVTAGGVIQPLRLVLPDETVLVALYTMQRLPGGDWRIAGCVLAPSTVQST